MSSSGRTLAQQIAALFRSGEQGAWYEPSLTNNTLYQDSAGTTPVTAMGQPVGLMLDKSGRGNHATQPTAINRPVIQQDAFGKYYLAFNGTNSWMSTASINFSATDKMTVVAGIRKLSDVNAVVLAETSTNSNATNGNILLLAPPIAAAASYAFRSKGTAGTSLTMAGVAAPHTAVFTATSSLASGVQVLRINTVRTTDTTDQGGGNYGAHPLYLGARAGSSLFFNGNLYGLIIRGALSSDAQIVSAERFMNSKTGAY